jgi:hypothetical protein
MITLPSFNTSLSGASSLASAAAASTVKSSDRTASAGGASSISTLARQLSEAAGRAAVRDASMTRAQLAVEQKTLMGQITGDGYHAQKAAANAEVPNTDDPELLARAKQATEFVNGSGGHAFRGTNPFAGLSRDQLALIIYDEGDAFTINERRAAYAEYSQQRQAWKQKVCAMAQAEQNATNTFTNFYKACIAEYNAGSPIEQAGYPINYVSRMQYYINLWEGGGDIKVSNDDHDALLRWLLPETVLPST